MPESEPPKSAPSDGGPPSLSDSARLVLGRRYLQRDDSMRIVETPDELFRRVATSVAQAESSHGATPDALANDAYALMSELEFLPNSPTLMNAGTESQQLAACFVLPVEDSLTDIFDTLKYAALIHQSGAAPASRSRTCVPPTTSCIRRTGSPAGRCRSCMYSTPPPTPSSRAANVGARIWRFSRLTTPTSTPSSRPRPRKTR